MSKEDYFIVGGVDVGSTTAKSVILDSNKKLLGKSLQNVSPRVAEDAETSFVKACKDAGIDRDQVFLVAGTGYGRLKVRFGKLVVTEISCHAKGSQFMFPNTRLTLDIGGQDTKAIRLGEKGEIIDFSMNDKCSAGTGRFLDVCAESLDYSLDDLGPVSLTATRPVNITSTCTVFAETEVSNQLARGRKKEDIVAGLHDSIAQRSLSLMRRVGIEKEITFTGGVSRNQGMVRSLENILNTKINVSPLSQWFGAIGAALYAIEEVKKGGEFVFEQLEVHP
ncbi:MAG: acyl-CoA dehydratase activase [Candidatus Heimdallarchaeota archaeon]|nr:acyl-CoA dehydratase activase [Candidatus Heimdallarchaeota archaeon]MDH5645786.1 acyl-CoA dehydratase activase [Candidatus Heimdallarchaeota archaeon]